MSVVDNDSGDVIGLLALTRKKQAPAGESEKKAADASQEETPGFFNVEVLGAVMAAVDELAVETKVDHYGRAFSQEPTI